MLYQRNILNKLKKWYENDHILLLNGPRQVGKTSILMLVKDELEKQGRQVIYLNLENFDVLNELNARPFNLLAFRKNPNEKVYFLLDEIQYLDNPSNFLKLLYDEYKGKIKIFATGSSALELKAKLQDSLTGRKITFLIPPLSFAEFLQFKQSPLQNYFSARPIPQTIKKDFIPLLNEYLRYGGLPAVVLENDPGKKEALLNEYVSTYINKDIRSIGKIPNLNNFNHLAVLLAGQIGNLINISEISNTLGERRRDIVKYLNLLNHTFVFDTVRPFSGNRRTQITKMPKGYWFDLGIRNQILGNFLDPESRTDAGALFENFIYLELKQKYGAERIFFYRTTGGAEIDFILKKESTIVPIEVKYQRLTRAKTLRPLAALQKNKTVSTGYCVNLNLDAPAFTLIYINFVNFISRI